jgi:MFS family permease
MEARLAESRAFWAVYVSVAVSYLGVGLVAPLIAVVLADRGENSFTVGLIGTTMFAAFTLASFPTGAIIDRLGPKPVLICGLVIYGASILLFAFIRVTWLFFAARALEGVGAAAISVATETIIGQLSAPDERARRMGYYAVSVGTGWALGPMTGTLLFGISKAAPFEGCFALSVTAALLVAVFVDSTASAARDTHALIKVFSLKLLAPVSAGCLYGYLMSSMVTLFPLYITSTLHLDETAMGAIITAVIIGTLVSQVPITRAADRFGRRLVLAISSAGLALVFFAMPAQQDWRSFVLLSAAVGALAGTLYPIGLSIVGGVVSRERLGAANALFSLAFGIGSLTGPSASGFVMTATGNPRWLFYLAGLVTSAFVVELILLYRLSAPREKFAPAD